MILVLDVENTISELAKGKDDFSPYRPGNKLVSCGWANVENEAVVNEDYGFFYHKDLPATYPVQEKVDALQAALDKATLVVGHNLKHDMSWLYECGFTYEGAVYDTMICEYVLARGLKLDLSLAGCCERAKVELKKSALVEGFYKDGIMFDAIPMAIVEEYGRGDIRSTATLFIDQQKRLNERANEGLKPTIEMMNEMLLALVEIERNGIKIDMAELDVLEKECIAEKRQIEDELNNMVYELMGDTPINLASNEHMAMVISGRKVIDKRAWTAIFNIGTNARGKPLRRPYISKHDMAAILHRHTTKLYKTVAKQCPECEGKGFIHKTKKDGSPFKRPIKCPTCCTHQLYAKHGGTPGVIYENTDEPAGLGMLPMNNQEVSTNGLSTSKEHLLAYGERARIKNDDKAIRLFTLLSRLNAVNVYLTSFCGGIRRKVLEGCHILHPNFNQCVTSTARLSSTDPNFQNQPRAFTFPIRRAIVSRFKGGKIAEADGAQLEYRCAGELSGCPDVLANVLAGEDAHAFTATTLTTHGQPTSRQEAKPHTFKPLYGGLSGTAAEVAYYRAFLKERHPRIGEWHKELQRIAMQHRIIRLPSGREYAFPHAYPTQYPSEYILCGQSTQIKNWPVQGWATGDVIPIAVILMWRAMKAAKCKSLLINTVHDSIVVDVYPGEEDLITRLFRETMLEFTAKDIKRRYNYTLRVPLGVEVKMGLNWLDTKEVLKESLTMDFIEQLAA